MKHKFQLKKDEPVYFKRRSLSPKHNKIAWEELQKMLKVGIIIPAISEWSSPVFIATKKDGRPRFCEDYRAINSLMRADRWPIPRIREIFDDLIGAKFFTVLDLFSGSWQVRLSDGFKDKTTFVCRYETFRFEVLPFGLINAPTTFQLICLLYTSPSPRDQRGSRMPSSA